MPKQELDRLLHTVLSAEELTQMVRQGKTEKLLDTMPKTQDDLAALANMNAEDMVNVALLGKQGLDSYIAEKEKHPEGKLEHLKQQILEEHQAHAAPIPDKIIEKTLPKTDKSCIKVTVGHDRMYAKVTLRHPEDGYDSPTYEDIMEVLAQNEVKKGIKFDYVRRLAEHPVYNTPFRIADGRPAVHGQDASLDLKFSPTNAGLPVEDEHGCVDYHELSLTQNVKQDDLLCVIVPPVRGMDGYDVTGMILPAKQGNVIQNILGQNVHYDEDGVSVYADCDGEVSFYDGKIHVSPVLEIRGNVDYSTGNIDFLGTVVIHGNVTQGFSVKAAEDIKVKGFVEGASLNAGHDIILAQGVNGGMKGEIEAGDTISALFAENVTLRARGDIRIGLLMNCNAQAVNSIVVRNGHGSIVGGEYVCMGNIVADCIGNAAGIKTQITIKSSEAVLQEHEENKKMVSQYESTILRLMQSVGQIKNSDVSAQEKQDAEVRCKIATQKIREEIKRMRRHLKIEEEILSRKKSEGCIYVQQCLYNNVYLSIYGAKMRTKYKQKACTLRRNEDDNTIATGPADFNVEL